MRVREEERELSGPKMAIEERKVTSKSTTRFFGGSALTGKCSGRGPAGSGRPPGLSRRSAAEVFLIPHNLSLQGIALGRREGGIERVKVPGEQQKFGIESVGGRGSKAVILLL